MFLLALNDIPIASEEDTASVRPIYLSTVSVSLAQAIRSHDVLFFYHAA